MSIRNLNVNDLEEIRQFLVENWWFSDDNEYYTELDDIGYTFDEYNEPRLYVDVTNYEYLPQDQWEDEYGEVHYEEEGWEEMIKEYGQLLTKKLSEEIEGMYNITIQDDPEFYQQYKDEYFELHREEFEIDEMYKKFANKKIKRLIQQ